MARKTMQVKRHVGYWAYVKSDVVVEVDHPEGGKFAKKLLKKRKFVKVGYLCASQQQAYDEARKHYGPKAEIRVQGARVDVRPFYVGIVNGQQTIIYEEYRPGPKQADYGCGSARAGKYC